MHMIVGSAVAVTLFLGGWHFFGLETLGGPFWSGVISFGLFFTKTAFFPLCLHLGEMDHCPDSAMTNS